MATEEVTEKALGDLGRRIRSCRESLDLSQGQLAQKIGIPRESITQYEAGAVNIPYMKVVDLASALRVPIQFLTGEEDVDPDVMALQQEDLTAQERVEVFSVARAYLETRRRMKLGEKG